MLKSINLTRFSLVALIALMVMAAPLKVKAQDDDDSEGAIVPTSSSSTATPPIILDEGDSEGVSDTEEYDG